MKKLMNYFSMLILLALVSLSTTGCLGEMLIAPGHVGVKVNLYGSNRGVADTTIVTGRTWYNTWYNTWNTQNQDVPEPQMNIPLMVHQNKTLLDMPIHIYECSDSCSS